MTSVFSPGTGMPQALAPLRAKWGWIVALGIVYLVAGMIALGSVVAATAASVLVVGVMMFVAGVFEVINAFQVKTWGRFIFWLLLGVLYMVAGFLAWDNPFLTAIWLTLFLGAALVASGVMRIFLAFNMKHGSPWVWVVVSGLITLAARRHYPGALAVLGRLHARHLPRRRPRLRRGELDQPRHGPEKRGLSASSSGGETPERFRPLPIRANLAPCAR